MRNLREVPAADGTFRTRGRRLSTTGPQRTQCLARGARHKLRGVAAKGGTMPGNAREIRRLHRQYQAPYLRSAASRSLPTATAR
jgi:hypothetical protein